MNRVIKFRVWDKVQSHFYYNYKIGELHTKNAGFISLNNVFNFQSDNLVFQQFTGILDNKNREIYEGDILKCGDNSAIAVVVFEDGMFVLDFTKSKEWQQNEEIHKGYQNKTYPLGWGTEEKKIVIGNLFQNSELLK